MISLASYSDQMVFYNKALMIYAAVAHSLVLYCTADSHPSMWSYSPPSRQQTFFSHRLQR